MGIWQVESTTQGILPPRMTTAQKNAIGSPATGLRVFDTDRGEPFFYNGTAWVPERGIVQTVYAETTADTTTTETAYPNTTPLFNQSITTQGNSSVIAIFTASASLSVKDRWLEIRMSVDASVEKGMRSQITDDGIAACFSATHKTGVLSAASHAFLVEWIVEINTTTGQIRPVTVPNSEHASLVLMEVLV
jgi:hypothetical protein